MKRYQKTIIAVIVLVSVAVGFYFVGYKTAYDRIEESPGSSSIPQTFYATITEINGNNFTVEGLDINDINYRGAFTFSVIAETELVWRVTEMQVDEFDIGDIISVSFTGLVQESYPGHILDVVRVQLLDDEK